MCEKLSLAPVMSFQLIVCIQSIALELLSWNKQHQEIFHTSAYITDKFLILSDWTIEGRLDETKIVERLVQEGKKPCLSTLSISIHIFFRTIYSFFMEPNYFRTAGNFFSNDNLGNNKMSRLVKLKSYHLVGKLHELIDDKNLLWQYQLKEAIEEGARTAFINFCKTLDENQKQENIVRIAIYVLLQKSRLISSQELWMLKLMQNRYHRQPVRPVHYSDILYFLLSQMSQKQRISFFCQAIQTCRQTIYTHTFNDCIFA